MNSGNIPQHIAIIMDGNRRWAKNKGLPTNLGHKEGYETFKKVADYCKKIGVKYLTVYAFSTENWKRSIDEVNGLMELLRFGISREQNRLKKKDFKIKVIGRISDLPEDLQHSIKEAEENTKENTGGIVNVAISYGGKAEIVDAIKTIIDKNYNSKDITEELITDYSYLFDQPAPDLIIRTGGEKRLSNFLMWHSGYSELYFTDKLWPDFSESDVDSAIKYYNDVKRNFGK